jgi:hypothetical protein
MGHIQCKHCSSIHGLLGLHRIRYEKSGIHIKAICGDCGKYIKFVSQDEIPPGAIIHYQHKHEMIQLEETNPATSPIPEAFDSQEEVDEQTGFDLAMKEINFKLDLLLDHFNIKEKKL